mgnify:CR=1 FL=1
MPTWTDASRTSRQDATFSFTNYKVKVWQPLKTIPPGEYIWSTELEFTIGDHFSCFGNVKLLYTTTQAGPSSSWSVDVYARVRVHNGHSTTAYVEQNILLGSSGTLANSVDYYEIDIPSITGTFAFSVTSDIKYDSTETATAVLDLPAYTILKQYERSQSGATASCSITISGTTVTQSSTVSTLKTTGYKFRGDIDTFIKSGLTSGVSQLLIQTMQTNLINVPDYNHNNIVSTDFYAKHRGTYIDAKNKGTDDVFGDPATTSLTMDSSVKLETPFKMLGKMNAFDISYPDNLTIKLTGLDKASLGYRSITASSSYQENDTFKFYDISSTVGGTTVTTGPVDTYPTTIKTEITSGLTAAGDDGKYTRLPMRVFPFIGINMELADETQITGGSGSSRTYSPTKNFNSYRYLELEIKSNTGNNETGTVTITCQPGTDTKTWSVSTNSTSYVRKRIDLICPNNKSTGIDAQDDPYPRLHPTDNNDAASERQNSAWYGVTRVSKIELSNTNLSLQNIYLVADPESSQSNYVFPPEYYVKVQTNSNTGTTYNGRRLWQQDTSGRSEEEYDVLNTSGTKAITTITDFVNRVNNNHPGWTASASTASGSGRLSYANSTNGYSSWIGGITWRADGSNGTIQKDYLNVVQNEGEPDCNVYAMVQIDEIDSSELIPDKIDPFGVYGSTTPLVTVCSATILRGGTHGQVISSNYEGAANETVDLLLTSTSANRGSGTTNTIGNYYTGSPKGLSNKNHTNQYTAGSQTQAINPIYAAKRYRTTFYPQIIQGDCISADKSPVLIHSFALKEGTKYNLYLTEKSDPNTYYKVEVPISSVSCAKMVYSPIFPSNRILFCVKDTSNNIKRYYSDDYGETVSMAITLGTGSSPAVCADYRGFEYYFWRTSGGDLYRAVYDAQGNNVVAASAVVTGTCQDKGIGCYERLGKIILVYSDSSTGLKQIVSTNVGETFA